jgi:hypothetical protein
MISELSNLADESDSDDPCADAIEDEWTLALEQYTNILARYNGIKHQQEHPDVEHPEP